MKLPGYGPTGGERPGLLHRDGTIRDLAGHVWDIAPDVLGPVRLAAMSAGS